MGVCQLFYRMDFKAYRFQFTLKSFSQNLVFYLLRQGGSSDSFEMLFHRCSISTLYWFRCLQVPFPVVRRQEKSF